MHILGDHFSVILYVLSPLYFIWQSPKALLAAQTLALALGALPVYAFSVRCLNSPPIALAFALVYLLYPPIQWSTISEFHPDTFGTPLLLGAFFYMSRATSGQPVTYDWAKYFVLLVLAALTKENVGLTIVIIGVYAWRRDPRVGAWTMALGVASTVLALAVIQTFNAGRQSAYFSLFSEPVSPISGPYPGAFSELTHSRGSAATILAYSFQLLFPVAFLPVFAPEVLVLALPAALLNVLSYRADMKSIYYHYICYIAPFTILAAVVGFRRLRNSARSLTPILLGLLLLCTCQATTLSPILSRETRAIPGIPRNRIVETRGILRIIPPNASVTAQASFLPHLSHRANLYMFPNPFFLAASGSGAPALLQQYGMGSSQSRIEAVSANLNSLNIDYIVLSPRTSIFPLSVEGYERLSQTVLSSQAYGIVAIGRDTMVLKRGASHALGLVRLAQCSGVPVVEVSDIGRAFAAWHHGGANGRSTSN